LLLFIERWSNFPLQHWHVFTGSK